MMKIGFRRFLRGESGEELSIPEISDGFDSSLETVIPGMNPVSYMTDKVPSGTYRIRVRIRAVRDVDRLYLFTGRRQLRGITDLKKGEIYEGCYLQNLAEIIPRWHSHIRLEERLFFTYCAENPEDVTIENCQAEPEENAAVIYLCGDSTVTDQAGEIPYHPGGCYSSWGQALPAFVHNFAAVQNQAHCGLTTESFRKEGHFDIVRHHLKKGDFCLFQFGHNDQKLPHLQADRDYPDNLRRFVEEVRKCQAVPVLVTPMGRNIWISPEEYSDLLQKHSEAVKRVAKETETALIDLHDASVKFIKKAGQVRACCYFHPDDYTHTNEYGAYLAASYVAERMSALFPREFPAFSRKKRFDPPADLWESIRQKNNRPAGEGQREAFDRMEKNVSDLLRVIKEAERLNEWNGIKETICTK